MDKTIKCPNFKIEIQNLSIATITNNCYWGEETYLEIQLNLRCMGVGCYYKYSRDINNNDIINMYCAIENGDIEGEEILKKYNVQDLHRTIWNSFDEFGGTEMIVNEINKSELIKDCKKSLPFPTNRKIDFSSQKMPNDFSFYDQFIYLQNSRFY